MTRDERALILTCACIAILFAAILLFVPS
jgi:hypothetical protein